VFFWSAKKGVFMAASKSTTRLHVDSEPGPTKFVRISGTFDALKELKELIEEVLALSSAEGTSIHASVGTVEVRAVKLPDVPEARIGHGHEGKTVLLRAPMDGTFREGARIIGTMEYVPGQAGATRFVVEENGDLTPEYKGCTEMDWDSQVTEQERGETLYVDEHGDIWRESELTLEPVIPENELKKEDR
jgi:hypothetical protein